MARRLNTASRPKALAFYGPGDSTFENTKDLLDDFLGFSNGVPDDDDTYLILPANLALRNKGAQSLFEWAEDHQLVYDVVWDGEDRPEEEYGGLAENFYSPKVLIRCLQEKHDTHDLFFVALWGDEGDKATEEFLDEAQNAGIMALDLTAGLDSIKLEDDSPSPEISETMNATPPWPETEKEGPVKAEFTPAEPIEDADEPLEPENSGDKESPLNIVAGEVLNIDEEIRAALDSAPAVNVDRRLLEILHETANAVTFLVGDTTPQALAGFQRLEEAFYWFSRSPKATTYTPRELDDSASFLGGDSSKDTPGVVTVDVTGEPATTPEISGNEEAPKRRRGRPRKTEN